MRVPSLLLISVAAAELAENPTEITRASACSNGGGKSKAKKESKP